MTGFGYTFGNEETKTINISELAPEKGRFDSSIC